MEEYVYMTVFLLPENPITSIEQYLATPVGGKGIKKAHELGASGTIDEIKSSGLRGRGGGGFETAKKWSGIAKQNSDKKYLVCNGAEGEPGTFKDRALMRANPYQLVEGVAIAAFVIGASESFICLKASFDQEIKAVTRAVQEFQSAGLCGDCAITIVAGPEEYLFGEEKAMLEVIEGNAPLPRWLPPYIHGLFATGPEIGWQSNSVVDGSSKDNSAANGSNPTLVNNVETLSNVVHILTHGASWFRTMGTKDSPGTIVTTVVGDVVAPDVGEVEMGASLRTVITAVGSGLGEGRSVKAVFSGVANEVIKADNLDVQISYEGFSGIGSGLGSAGFIVYDDTTCMVDIAYLFSKFLSVESCGQCPPCKLGSSAITQHLEKIQSGVGSENDLEAIFGWLKNVTDGNRCYLAVEEQKVVSSIIAGFPKEFSDHIENGQCSNVHKRDFPKLVDLADGRALYDESFWRKQPDWTYLEDDPSI